MTAPDVATILADPRWLAHRYDPRRDEIHFVWLPREAHRAAGFLTQLESAQTTKRHAVPRRLLAGHKLDQAPLHLILHSGLTGSTLLTRIFDKEGLAMTLSEPPILTDIVSHRLSGATQAQTSTLIDDILGLLARPFAPGEAVILKAGAIANSLGNDILARRPTSKALCLHAPLPIYLASIVRKGVWGRIWGRKLFGTLRSARLTDIGFSEEELFEQTDLQIAADCWLILHRVMGDIGSRFGPRVRATDSEVLFTQTEAALNAIASHFDLTFDAAAIMADPLFRRHAKSGEEFDSKQRADELREATAAHREEIEMIVDWARKVADAQNIRLDLSGRLDL